MSDRHGLSQLPAWLEGVWVCQTNTVYHNYRPGLRAFGGVRQTRFITSTHGPIYPGGYRSMQIPAWIGGNWVCQTNSYHNYRPGLGVFGSVRQTQFYHNYRPGGLGVFGSARQTQFYHNYRPGLGVFGCVRQTQFITTTGPAWGCLGVSDKQGLLQQVGGL